MQTQTAAAALYATLVTYPADQRDAILVALCALQLAAVPVVEPDKPVIDIPTVPDVVVDEKPTTIWADGQEIKNWYGESVRARYKDGILYATSGGANTFRDQGFLGQIGLTPDQVALFADSDPRSTAPIDAVPDPPIIIDQPATDSVRPTPAPIGNSGFRAWSTTQRRWGLNLFHYGPTVSAFERKMYGFAAKKGAGLLFPLVLWAHMQPTPDSEIDFTIVDDIGEVAKSLKTPFHLRIAVARNERWAGFFNESDRECDEDGNVGTHAGHVLASLYCEAFLGRARAFVRAIMQHIAQSDYAQWLWGVAPVRNGFWENEQAPDLTLPDGRTIPTILDYSQHSRRAFISYAQSVYKNDLEAANKAWKTAYKAWNDVQLPRRSWGSGKERVWDWSTVYMQDFYRHRALGLANWTDALLEEVQAIAPEALLVQEHGNAMDGLSIRRATMGTRDKQKRVQICKSNDDPYYNGRLTTALSLGLTGKGALNEIWFGGWDGSVTPRYPVNELVEQGVGFLLAGGLGIALAGPYLPTSDNNPELLALSEDRIAQFADALMRRAPLTDPVAIHWDGVYEIALSRLLSKNGWGESGAADEYNKLTENGTKRIRVNILFDQ